MTDTTDNRTPDLDRVAVVLSGLCILHCLALPIVLLALPVLAEFAEGHWHLPMLAIALPVSVAAIVIGYRRHGNRRLVVLGALGLALLVLGATVAHAFLGPTADRTLTIAGSLLLAWVHWQNSRALRANRGRMIFADF